jgi:hypothetical protein
MPFILIVSLIMAAIMAAFGTVFILNQRAALEACVKKHNVCRCEMVAVPVTGEEGE